MNIKNISNEELMNDLEASLDDIMSCNDALSVGITTYSGGSVADRLETNQNIVAMINAEIKRRADET